MSLYYLNEGSYNSDKTNLACNLGELNLKWHTPLQILMHPTWWYIFTRAQSPHANLVIWLHPLFSSRKLSCLPLPLASFSAVAGSLTPAVLWIWKWRIKWGCPLCTHSFASTLATWGGKQFVWRTLLFITFCPYLPLICTHSGVKAVSTAIIMFISLAAPVAWNFSFF